MKYLKFFEEIGSEKVLSAERQQGDNLASKDIALGVDGEVNQYGFDCVYITYKGVQQNKFDAVAPGNPSELGRINLIVDIKNEGDGAYMNNHKWDSSKIVKVINGKGGSKAVFLKDMLCFVIPNVEGGDTQVFRGWIKTNDRTKVVGFLKKWDIFGKVNANDIMLVADKLKNIQNLKSKTGEIKGSKKVTIEDVNSIINSDSKNKAEEIMKLFGK